MKVMKIGDKVQVINNISGYYGITGTVVAVSEVDNNRVFTLESHGIRFDCLESELSIDEQLMKCSAWANQAIETKGIVAMSKVFDGLNILMKYSLNDATICAEHDEIFIHGIDVIEENDRQELLNLGFDYDDEMNCWHRFV